MRRLWSVSVTVVENWEAWPVFTTWRFEVLADDAQDAERIIGAYLIRQYHCTNPTLDFRFQEFIINPLMCDMNAIRDNRIPVVRRTN